MSRSHVGLRLFLTAWVLYAAHFATNIVREYYPAFSLAEHGTLRVDDYLGLHPDLFELEGRGAFINNNPGSSILAALPYALARPAVDRIVAGVRERRAAAGAPPSTEYDDPRPLRRKFFRQVRERGLDVRFGLASGVIQLGFTAPVSALAVVVMRGVLLRMGFAATPALLLALLYGFGTPVFFRSGFLNQNLLIAQLSLFAFALLYRNEAERPPGRGALLAAGGLTGFCVVCDYSGVVPIAVLGSWALAEEARRRGAAAGLRRTLWLVAGGAAAAALLPAYQAWAFGHPIWPAQHYMPATEYSGQGWNGVNWPAADLALQNLFDPRFGLFTAGPLLLLAFAAPFLRGPRPRLRASELALAFGVLVGSWLFASCIEFARLQWNTGVRYLMPAVPFLFLAAAGVLARLPRPLALGLGAASLLQCWAHAMVRETPWISLLRVLGHGPELPWLTSIGRTGARLPILLPDGTPRPLPVLLLLAALGVILWWPLRSRRPPLDEEGPGTARRVRQEADR